MDARPQVAAQADDALDPPRDLDRSCGLLVFALMAPSMTMLSTLAAMMPPRWMRPVTGLYIVESVACWLFCVLIRST
jgi:hypothetical protein